MYTTETAGGGLHLGKGVDGEKQGEKEITIYLLYNLFFKGAFQKNHWKQC